MTQFLDCRIHSVGGDLAASVATVQATSLANYTSLPPDALRDSIRGRHVLLVAHGFNVDRSHGIDCLSNWERLLQFPLPSAFVGILWPGDSIWAHGLDYPEEPKIADDAGILLAEFINANFQQAASISFASHSLGARVVLATISHLNLPVRRVILMAPAIDDNCLATEFEAISAKIASITVLASMKDQVLSMAFPMGNFFAGIMDAGHPWWRAALGHCGPATPWPANLQAPFEIPDDWNFQHGDYLQIDQPQPAPLPLPVDLPPQGTPPPPGIGWQEAFSSAFTSTRFR
jgi:pimeloyl-ACP methyl ester carboxylesterase